MTTEQMDWEGAEASGKHERDRLEKEAAMERKLAEPKLEAETGMAEEPIEDRLRRAWLNGFRDGVNRASWGAGRWDHQ